MRKTGIEIIGDARWGTHFCQFYQTRTDLADILVPYFKAGLEQNEFCMWITSPDLTCGEAEAALRKAVPNLSDYLEKGQIEILAHTDWYLKGGSFDKQRVLDGWISKLELAQAMGFDGLRLSGNTVWLEKADWEKFAEYERAVDEVIGRYQIIALCTYPLASCSAVEILEMMRNHQFALIKGDQGWQMVENSDLKRARERALQSEQALRESRHRLSVIVDSIADGLYAIDRQWRFIHINKAALSHFGRADEQFIGRNLFEVFPAARGSVFESAYRRAFETGEPAFFETASTVVERTVEVHAYPGPDSLTVIFRDITERKQREQELQKLNRTLQALSNSSQAMMRARDEKEFLDEVCQIVVKDCGYAMVWIGLAEEDEYRTVRPVAHAGFEEGYLESLRISWADTDRGRGPTGTSVRTGKPAVCADILHNPQFIPWREQALRRGYASSIALPLISGERTFGAITIYSKEQDAFSENEVKLLSQLADDLSFGIMSIRWRMGHEKARAEAVTEKNRLEAVMETLPVGVSIIDAHGGNIRSNPMFERIWGGRGPKARTVRDYSQYKAWWLNTGKPVQPEEWAAAKAVHRGETVVGQLMQIEKFNGSRAFVLNSASPIFDAEGHISGSAVAILDITDRVQGEEALRQSEERYRRLFEDDLTGDFIAGKNGEIHACNPAFLRLYGFSNLQEALKGSLADFNPQEWPEILTRLKEQGRIERHQARHHCPDGREIYVVENVVGIFDASGELVEIKGYIFDNTEQHKAQEALYRSNARLNLLAETAGELLGSDSPQEVVESLCRKVMAFLDCQAFFNFLVDEEAGKLHLNACAGVPPEVARKIEWLDYGVAVCGCVARDGRRIVAEDNFHTPDPRTDLVKSYGIQAYACHPLLSQGKVLGTLSFGTRTRVRFTEDELALMKAVADQVALAMERVQTKQALQQANEELEQRVNERTAALQEKSRFLEAFFHHSLDSLVFLDKQFNFIRVNETYAKACGRDAAEFIGRSHFELYPHPENQAIFEEVVRTKKPYSVQAKPFVFPDHPEWGVTYWDWTLVPVLDANREVDSLVFSLRDVSKRERAEREVRTASRYARSLIEASLDPLVTISPKGQITDVNQATELVTGIKRDRLIGSDFSDYFTEPEKARTGYLKVISEGWVRDYPLTIRHVSGHTTDVLYNATVYRNEAGQIEGVFAAARDITERKEAEREVRTAFHYARSLLEASLDPLVTISPKGQITDVNQATELVTGIQRDRLIGSDFSDYFTEPDKARAGYLKVISEGWVRDYPLTIRHVSGRTTDVLYNATVYRNEAGQMQGVFAAARDITERKEAERRRDITNNLLELFARKSTAKEYLDSVVEVIRRWSDCDALGIRIADDQSEIPYQAWTGFAPGFLASENRLSLENDTCCCVRAVTQEIEDQDKAILTPGGSLRCDNAPEFINQLAPDARSRYRGNCLRSGYTSLAIIPIRYRDQVLGALHLADQRPGHFTPAKVEFIETMSPLIGEAIHRFHAEAELVRYRDHLEELVKQRTSELESANTRLQSEIVERKRAEESVRRTAEELARSNEDLEQFAYVASHDLQEPLRAVAGFMGLLERRYQAQLDAKAQEYITGAVDGAARMQSLINDLLTYSRIDRGRVPEPVAVQSILDHALANLHASIHETGAVITTGELPTIWADAVQITQLFQNLIGNAIKFRGDKRPEIEIRVDLEPGFWRFAVQDHGIGIDPQYANRIFLIFQRLHNRKQYPGTGIGLAICKKIVERHGGTIWVESALGQGATFYFTIPDRNK